MKDLLTFVFAILLMVIVGVFLTIRKKDCSAKHCPDNLQPTIIQSQCICVQPARD